MEIVDFVTYCLTTLQKFLVVKESLIPIALVSIGVMLRMTERVRTPFIVMALWIIGMVAGWALISPPAQGALAGCVYAGIATIIDTKYYGVMADKAKDFLKNKLNSTNPPNANPS